MNPKVSIVIPTFNNEKEISQTIQSVLSQTYTNFELICVNDGSTDQTKQILQRFQKDDRRIIVKSLPNGGAASARNEGLAIASGKYIYFLDADDCVKSNLLADNIALLEKYNADCLLFSHTELIEQQKIHHRLNLSKTTVYNNAEFSQKFISLFTDSIFNSFYSINKIYRKSFIDQNHIQFPNKIFGEDAAFSYSVYQKLNKIVINPNEYYEYIKRPGSVSSNFVVDNNRLKDELETAATMNQLLNDNWHLNTSLGNNHAIWAIYHYINQNSLTDITLMKEEILPFLGWNTFWKLSFRGKIQFLLIRKQL